MPDMFGIKTPSERKAEKKDMEMETLRSAFGEIGPETLADRRALSSYNCKGRLITYAEISYLVGDLAAVLYQDAGEPEIKHTKSPVSDVFLRGLLQLSHYSTMPLIGRAVLGWRNEVRRRLGVEADRKADSFARRAAKVIRRLLEYYPLTPGQDYEGIPPGRLLYWRDRLEFYHRPEAARLYRLGLMTGLKQTGRTA